MASASSWLYFFKLTSELSNTDNIGSFGYGNSNGDIEGNDKRSDARREKVAEDMWRDYQEILAERGMLDNTDKDSQEESFSSDEWDEEDENY